MGKNLLTVICLCYNQERFIGQTIDGFISQKCDFDFNVLIQDDASTDDTVKIVERHIAQRPEIFDVNVAKENQYSKGVDIFGNLVTDVADGKYIAVCAGDDYWCDPFKLQRQVDYMETHPDCGATATKAKPYYQHSGEFGSVIGNQKVSFTDLLHSNPIPALTAMVRRDVLLAYLRDVNPESMAWKMEDYPMWLYMAANGYIHFDNRVTSVYRVVKDSLSHKTNLEQRRAFLFSEHDVKLYFAERYLPSKVEHVKEMIAYDTLEFGHKNDDHATIDIAKGEIGRLAAKRHSVRAVFTNVICKNRILSSFLYS